MLNKLTLRYKIMVCYAILIAISISISLGVFFLLNNYVVDNIVQDIAVETIKSDNRAYDVILQDVTETSKIIIASQLVQDALSENQWEYDSSATSYLKSYISFNANISAAYLFRNDGRLYFSEKRVLKDITYKDIKNSPFYPTLVDRNGGYLVVENADGSQGDGIRYLTFFRLVRSLKTLEPIGVLCLYMEFDKLFNSGNEPFKMIDLNGVPCVVKNNKENAISDEQIRELAQKDDVFSTIKRTKEGGVVVVGVKNKGLNMYFVRCIPIHDLSIPTSIFTIMVAATIAINGIMIIFGSIWISNYIPRPIEKLIVSMKGVYNGHFEHVEQVTAKDEFGTLQDVYNVMIDKIQVLLNTIIEEQKALRSAELEITMAQIKPHFLYNTLDSINSLAVMGRTKEVTETIKALGDFYRISLNNGKEMVLLEQELESIRSYVYIQQMRYSDLFEVTYSIQPETLKYSIPKMILQPLVENAIYHGIRGAVPDGVIAIETRLVQGTLYIEVRDNGIGMEPEKLEEVMAGESVGLGATMKRIAIIYGARSRFEIKSTPGAGTQVLISIDEEVLE